MTKQTKKKGNDEWDLMKVRSQVVFLKLCKGINYADLAKRIGKSKSLVSKVLHGSKTSKPCLQAIQKEIRKIDPIRARKIKQLIF